MGMTDRSNRQYILHSRTSSGSHMCKAVFLSHRQQSITHKKPSVWGHSAVLRRKAVLYPQITGSASKERKGEGERGEGKEYPRSIQ